MQKPATKKVEAKSEEEEESEEEESEEVCKICFYLF